MPRQGLNRQGRCDVDRSTERKDSSHVLMCTKNQAGYGRSVAQSRTNLDGFVDGFIADQGQDCPDSTLRH
jgi:hypothetical protein